MFTDFANQSILIPNSLRLPDRRHLTKTNDEDPLAFYYHWLTGPLYRKRLELALRMLGNQHYDSLLEVGFGSGILLPELARRTNNLFGVETHDQIEAVRRMLSTEGVRADLRQGSILALEFEEANLRAVVCLSVLEHMTATELPLAIGKLKRVVRHGGVVVTGFPVRNVFTDTFYRFVGFRPRDIHPSSHRDIIVEMKRQFSHVGVVAWPSFLPLDISLYVVCQCTR
jgi:SAM-dependent methyltransferase